MSYVIVVIDSVQKCLVFLNKYNPLKYMLQQLDEKDPWESW